MSVTLANGTQYGLDGNNDASGTLTFYVAGAVNFTRTDTTYKDQAGYLGLLMRDDASRTDDFGGGITVAAAAGRGEGYFIITGAISGVKEKVISSGINWWRKILYKLMSWLPEED